MAAAVRETRRASAVDAVDHAAAAGEGPCRAPEAGAPEHETGASDARHPTSETRRGRGRHGRVTGRGGAQRRKRGESARRAESRVCFGCGMAGHVARDCGARGETLAPAEGHFESPTVPPGLVDGMGDSDHGRHWARGAQRLSAPPRLTVRPALRPAVPPRRCLAAGLQSRASPCWATWRGVTTGTRHPLLGQRPRGRTLVQTRRCGRPRALRLRCPERAGRGKPPGGRASAHLGAGRQDAARVRDTAHAARALARRSEGCRQERRRAPKDRRLAVAKRRARGAQLSPEARRASESAAETVRCPPSQRAVSRPAGPNCSGRWRLPATSPQRRRAAGVEPASLRRRVAAVGVLTVARVCGQGARRGC